MTPITKAAVLNEAQNTLQWLGSEKHAVFLNTFKQT